MTEHSECYFTIEDGTADARRAADLATALVTAVLTDDYAIASELLNDVLRRTDDRPSRGYVLAAMAHLAGMLAVFGASDDEDPFEFLSRVVLKLRLADMSLPPALTEVPS